MNGPLTGINVVDLGSGQAASMATLLLAQAGAFVTKLDDASADTILQRTQDTLWNRLKKRFSIDSRTQQGRAEIHQAIASADILIHDKVPSEARLLGLDADTLDARFPNLIHVAIGAWPAGHPKEDTPVRDVLALAEAGLLDEQEAVGRDGPIYLRFPLGSNHAAYLAAVGALARLCARRRTGLGGRVQTSLVQGALIPMMMHWSRAERPTRSVAFGMPKNNSPATLFECGDGRWIHTMGQVVQAPTIRQALEAMPPEDRARHNLKFANANHIYLQDWGAIEAIFKTGPRDAWLNELWASDVPAQPVLKMGEIYSDVQAVENGFIAESDVPELGSVRLPGTPFQIEPQTAEPTAATQKSQTLRFPLEGVKVLDLGNFLAGPLAAMILGDLGAEVIKLEAASGDPLRSAEWAFNGCQRNKRAIAIQLKDPKGREVMQQLVQWADILHHNQRMPAAAKLGFDYPAAHAINPKLIYCHVSSYGTQGARKDWPGYDQLFQAAAGWEHEGAGEGNPPIWNRFGMMDHLGALVSVMATLLALLRRDQTGSGEFIAASLLGASVATVETFVLPDGTLAPYLKLDSEQLGVSPVERLYKCRDGWLAVSARSPDSSLDTLTGIFGTVEIAPLLAELSLTEARARFANSDICAVEVRLNNKDVFFDDPANHALGLVTAYDHAAYGRLEQIGALWDFGKLAVRIERAPPVLGQHTTDILNELGYDETAQASLAASGIIARSVPPVSAVA